MKNSEKLSDDFIALFYLFDLVAIVYFIARSAVLNPTYAIYCMVKNSIICKSK